MRRTGLLYDERFKLHKTGPGHPEAPERLTAILHGLEKADLLTKLIPIPATAAAIKWVEKVHSPKYIPGSRKPACSILASSTAPTTRSASRPTKRPARCGGILKAVDMLMEGKIDNALCVCVRRVTMLK